MLNFNRKEQHAVMPAILNSASIYAAQLQITEPVLSGLFNIYQVDGTQGNVIEPAVDEVSGIKHRV